MSEIMTLHNMLIGAIAIFAVKAIVWKYWSEPREMNRFRKAVRDELERHDNMKAGTA